MATPKPDKADKTEESPANHENRVREYAHRLWEDEDRRPGNKSGGTPGDKGDAEWELADELVEAEDERPESSKPAATPKDKKPARGDTSKDKM